MPTETARIQHVLTELVPDIRKGCNIQTSKGDLHVTGRDADALALFVQDLYNKKAQLAVQIDGCAYCED